MRYLLISCEIFFREVCLVASRSPHRIDLQFLPKGLHDLGAAGMQAKLAAALAGVNETPYDAILLGYALCNNGVVGLKARTKPLVLPRAHDCITLFLGSKERYLEYFHNNLGTYFLTSGWVERGWGAEGQLAQASIEHQTGMDQTYQQLVEKYGEDNAKFLYEQLVDTSHNYHKYAYISVGLETDARFAAEARRLAAERNWEFEKVPGELGLIERLVNGPWADREFLVVQPGQQIAASYDPEQIVTAVDAGPADA